MLTFVEELLVLLVDEDRGDLIGIPARTLNYALTGAALLDLRLAYRIDTGATTLTVVDPMPPATTCWIPSLPTWPRR